MNSIAKKTAIQIAVLCLLSPLALPQETPTEYQEVLKIVGRSGGCNANILKVNIPRNDLHVKVSGYALPTPFGFGGRFARTKGDGGEEVVMGDLVWQDEVNTVMSALLEHGFEVTAFHNPFLLGRPAGVLHAYPWAWESCGIGKSDQARH
jgi:hypothetical protein